MQFRFFRSVRFPGDWELDIGIGRAGWCGNYPGESPPPGAAKMNWWSLRIGRSQFAFWHNHQPIFNFMRSYKV